MTAPRPRFIKDAVAIAVVFAACLAIFLTAPVKQAGADSRYSMLLSENLLRHRQFALERYGLPISDYRLINVDGHRYYAFPPGTSVLSLPYVSLMHLRGRSVVHADGTYDPNWEAAREMHLSALLMAAFAVVVFATSRLLLPTGWSLAVAFTTAFGTQFLSTMSRAMWSDTWACCWSVWPPSCCFDRRCVAATSTFCYSPRSRAGPTSSGRRIPC